MQTPLFEEFTSRKIPMKKWVFEYLEKQGMNIYKIYDLYVRQTILYDIFGNIYHKICLYFTIRAIV